MQHRGGAVTSGEILELVRAGTVRTRREVQDLTGLSRSTLAQRMSQLLTAGYIRESGQIVGAAGRPTKVISFDGARQFVVAAGLGANHAELAVIDADGGILAEATHDIRIGDGPERTLRRLNRRLTDLITASQIDRARCVGLGVGIPGHVRTASGRPNHPPLMPGWHDYPIAEHLSRAQHLPVYVDNDANLMALGESRVRYPTAASLVFVKVGTGIGAGLVLSGSTERGTAGAAGGIGHIRIAGHHPELRCTCGAFGCLATQASGGALVRQLQEAGREISKTRDVAHLVRDGDPLAIRLVEDAGRLIGKVLATSVALLNPAIVVIGGEIGVSGPYLVDAITEVIHDRTLPIVSRGLTIAVTALGERAAAHGARHLVIDEMFSAAAVDSRLNESAAL
jgi:predicted NBD/HSP70 family sugar kinase